MIRGSLAAVAASTCRRERFGTVVGMNIVGYCLLSVLKCFIANLGPYEVNIDPFSSFSRHRMSCHIGRPSSVNGRVRM